STLRRLLRLGEPRSRASRRRPCRLPIDGHARQRGYDVHVEGRTDRVLRTDDDQPGIAAHPLEQSPVRTGRASARIPARASNLLRGDPTEDGPTATLDLRVNTVFLSGEGGEPFGLV